MRVLVVGAGLAGLSAALDLQARGVNVTLLDGGLRAGGRVRTVRSPFRGGQHAESGAEWVDSHHVRMLALLARHGLSVEGEGTRWTTLRRWVHVGGELLDSVEANRRYGVVEALGAYEALVERYAAGIVDPADPVAHTDAAAVDALSVADVLDRLDANPVARLLVERSIQAEFAAEAHELSVLFLAQQRAVTRDAEPVVAHRVVGGVDQLTRAMAGEVADLRLGATVAAVEHDADGAIVRTAGGEEFEGDHVVLTSSPVALRAMHFEPALPSVLAAAVAELGFGAVTKTALQYASRWWPPGHVTSDTAFQRAYEPTADQPGAGGILLSYRGGDGARSWTAAEAERMATIDGLLRGMATASPAAPIGGFSRAWHEHARFGGAYAVYRPGQVTAFWRVLRQPQGRLWLAGEHTATVTGYMEGAVETGQRVAAAITAVG